MTTTPNAIGTHSALTPQPKALRVAAILRERLGIDCLAAELLESQYARIVELEAQAAAKCLHQIEEPGEKVYAPLPITGEEKWTAQLYTGKDMRSFADATDALRAAPPAPAAVAETAAQRAQAQKGQ